MKTSLRFGRAFTLIELLIVVAIIAILAAIAVPNFLEAQTRAKVSRVRSDLRSVATALESYRIDNNNYPPTPFWGSSGVLRVIPNRLSTPISYISTANFLDPFVDSNLGDFQYFGPSGDVITYSPSNTISGITDVESSDPIAGRRYYYQSNRDGRRSNQADYEAARAVEGDWAIASYGPNRARDIFITSAPGAPFVLEPYDPTNGTISGGDIIRTQLESEGTLRE